MYKNLYKGTLILAVGIIVLVSSFIVPWDMILPPFQVVQRWEWEVRPGSVGIVPIDLMWGTRVRGVVGCLGGNDDIDFRITDSADNILYNPERIQNDYKFRWQAPTTDIFHFKFDNTISVFITKTVGYSIGLYYYFHVLLLVGTTVAIVGFCFQVKGAFEIIPKKDKLTCKHCGTRNKDSAIYCRECGEKIGKEL